MLRWALSLKSRKKNKVQDVAVHTLWYRNLSNEFKNDVRILSYEVCNKYFLALELIALQWFNAVIIRIIIFVSSVKSCVFLDLMKLKRIQDGKKKAAGSKKKTDNVLSGTTPGLCVDFHPTVSLSQLVWSCSFIQAVIVVIISFYDFRMTSK